MANLDFIICTFQYIFLRKSDVLITNELQGWPEEKHFFKIMSFFLVICNPGGVAAFNFY